MNHRQPCRHVLSGVRVLDVLDSILNLYHPTTSSNAQPTRSGGDLCLLLSSFDAVVVFKSGKVEVSQDRMTIKVEISSRKVLASPPLQGTIVDLTRAHPHFQRIRNRIAAFLIGANRANIRSLSESQLGLRLR